MGISSLKCLSCLLQFLYNVFHEQFCLLYEMEEEEASDRRLELSDCDNGYKNFRSFIVCQKEFDHVDNKAAEHRLPGTRY